MNQAGEQARLPLLYTELRWLMRLRWVAAALIVAGGVTAGWWLAWYDHGPGMVAVGVLLAAANAVFAAIDRRAAPLRDGPRRVLTFATAQLAVDLACLGVLVLWTGGVSSPLMGFFIFQMVFASLLQPRRRAYATAIATIAALAVGLWLTGQWPAGRGEALAGAGWAIAALVTVYLSDRITGALYRREAARRRQNRRLRGLMTKLRSQQAALVQQEKMAAMGGMAAGIVHEIMNPLASMDSVLQLMQRSPGTPRPDSVNALREQVQRIHRTVRQLTTFAHPGKGRVELVAVNDVVRTALDMLSFDRRVRRVNVEATLQDSAGQTRLNAHAMEQVLTNIFRNAIDAMEGRPEPRLGVRTWRENGHCVIEVADNGCGIRREDLGRVFEPFFTTKAVGEGTGLGLSISANLVREHGGRIDVESQPDRGTKFTIRIPATGAAAGPVEDQVAGARTDH
ncbi:MAG: hypothetical protein IT436_04800 [Phycisphaerales bacterium]|nr:hypothetical protein [Phycisphaerales bacterium]